MTNKLPIGLPDLKKSNSWIVDPDKSPTKIRVRFYNGQQSVLKFNEEDSVAKLFESVSL